MRRYFKFLAHESAHLWNGQMFDDPDEVMWLHEGGADAYAFRVMKEAKIISERQYKDLLTEALNECLYQLDGKPIFKNPGFDREHRPSYYCGSTVHFIVENILQQHRQKSDLFFIWKELFKRASANKNQYTEKMYFDLAEELSGQLGLGEQIREFIHNRSQGMDADFLPLLKRAGVQVIERKKADEVSERKWGKRLLLKLVEGDCGGYSMYGRDDHYLVETQPGCKLLKKNIKVSQIENLEIIPNGARAYDMVFEKCKDKMQKIRVGNRDEAVDLTCVSLSRRPKQYYIK